MDEIKKDTNGEPEGKQCDAEHNFSEELPGGSCDGDLDGLRVGGAVLADGAKDDGSGEDEWDFDVVESEMQKCWGSSGNPGLWS